MRSIIFDTGPLITLTLNNLIWLLEPLKKRFEGNFYISESVKRELIDRPLDINRFKFEALCSLRYLRQKTIELYPEQNHKKLTEELLELSNKIFSAHGNYIKVMHIGEIETIALACFLDSEAIVVDERTTIEIIENPRRLKKHLSKKLHTKVSVNKDNLNRLKGITKNIRVIRSIELAIAAYETGLLDCYLPDKPYNNEFLLDAVLWGLKLNGCAVSEDEIKEIIKLEK